MTTSEATPTVNSKQRFKGRLAGTLVRTLLIFALIPFAVMAGAAYLRARFLLREQATRQFQSLMVSQGKIVANEIANKNEALASLLEDQEFRDKVELGLHVNRQQLQEYQQLRRDLLFTLYQLNAQENSPNFDEFILMDGKGRIKLASNSLWEGSEINATTLKRSAARSPSFASYGLSPVIENEFVLVTAYEYKTARGSSIGVLAAITSGKNLKALLRPFNGMTPLARTYLIPAGGQFVFNAPEGEAFPQAETLSPEQQKKIAAALAALQANEKNAPAAMEIRLANGEAALAQIQWLPAMQAGWMLEVNARDVYGNINTSLLLFTALLLATTLAGMALVLHLGVNRVIKPLRVLSEVTQQFAEGDWSRRLEVHSDDEVGLLTASFNKMADELSKAYHTLKQQVEERTRQIHAAAQTAQTFANSTDLDEMLEKTVELLVRQFDFYQASIFLLDRGGQYLEFKTGFGAGTQGMKEKKYRLQVGSNSIMGWVSANNQMRVASDVEEDELHLKNDLLPETRSEATLPISIGTLILGVLDVQSAQPGAFNSETVAMLQTVASQLATAIQSSGLTEINQVNFEEISRLYRSTRLIAEARTESEALQNAYRVLKETPYVVGLLRALPDRLEIFSSSDETKEGKPVAEFPRFASVTLEECEQFLSRGPVIVAERSSEVPANLRTLIQQAKLESAAFLPVRKRGSLAAILMMGSREGIVAGAPLQPYVNLTDLLAATLEKAEALQETEKHLREVESLASINEAISKSSNLKEFFETLHKKIQQIIGDYSLIVALYDETSNTINVPFSYEDGQISSIESFPLGEGLTSILIRTRQSLLLVEDTERKAAALGAKIVGRAARSWMGAPMMMQNKPIGALILQDAEREKAFNENDLRLFNAIASQVAGVIHNVRLLEESQRKALQLETASEIARDISGTLHIEELLGKAVNLIRERFDFYHAAIYLLDLSGEFAVIREATGEAGLQMKRSGHKISVGSKSIVGFVSARGEPLVVNDVSKEATYEPHAALPNTRSEAALPLKAAERILGVLDVQSDKLFAFTEDNLRILQILADQVAVAVVNTELFAETQEHLAQHRLLHYITANVASGVTLEEALENAVGGLQVTLGGDRVIILLTDKEKKKLEVKASVGYSEDVSRVKVDIGVGIIGWVAAHRRPLRVGDVRSDPRYLELSPNTRSELAAPLMYRNELLGVLNVESEQVNAYAEGDEEMLGTLGGSLAAIIANARLLEQIRLQAERERLVYEISGKIRRSTDIQSILTATAGEITRVVGARYARISILRQDEQKGS